MARNSKIRISKVNLLKGALYMLSLISVILYLCAPKEYSFRFSLYCSIIFFLSSIILLFNNCSYTVIKFEFFFIISVFFADFCYSLFLYPVNPHFSLFNLEFNEDYLNKGLALSTVAMCFFYNGIFEKEKLLIDKNKFRAMSMSRPNALVTILLIAFIPYLIKLKLAGGYTTEFETSLLNAILIYVIFYYLLAFLYKNRGCHSLRPLINRSLTIPNILIIIYVILFLLIGSRTIPMRVVLFTFFAFSVFIKLPSKKITFFLIAAGALLLTVVGSLRGGGGQVNLSSILDIGTDLTINNRSLYVLMEYADTHGYNMGMTMLMNLLSIIPFGQRYFLKLSGIPLTSISSGQLVTHLFFDEHDLDTFGLGTNLFGDIYVSFGLVGVIILMYLLGVLLRFNYSKICEGEVMYVLFYAIFFMDVVYITRSGYLTPLRGLVWTYVIYYIFRHIKTPKEKR